MQHPAEIRLIVGLGNFPPEYANTRHNAGRWFVERLANEYNVILRYESRLQCLVAKVDVDGEQCLLAAPAMYMNESGRGAALVAKFYKILPENILLVHDELDFPAGSVKLKFGGGHGGHNGISSVANSLSSRDFARLRIGIGHPGNRDLVVDYVLHKPSKSEQQLIDDAIERALLVVPKLLDGEWERAVNDLAASAH